MNKIFSPKKENYLYLYSEMAEVRGNGTSNKSWKWNIPKQDVTNCEISVKSICSTNTNVGTKYIIRCPLGDNIYDSLFGLPIIYISDGMNEENIIDAPMLILKNRTLNTFEINITNSFLSQNRDAGIPTNISFVICVKIVDYIPDEITDYYTPNPKQRFDLPNYHQ